MPRFKADKRDQHIMVPICLADQLLPGTFEYALNLLVEERLDLSAFEACYNNDETGAPAYHPAILLKVVLFAYSRGIVRSREIARCCVENVTFMALSGDSQPHFTTIASFVSERGAAVADLYGRILMICDELGLIGREMFAVDGCKLPSNASKEWSGTKADLSKKRDKMQKAAEYLLERHRQADGEVNLEAFSEREEKQLHTLDRKITKVEQWLDNNDEKIGQQGKPIKSNITDNESAKMKTSHGVIQGYIGVAVADDKHQVIVQAEAFGAAQEHQLLQPVVESIDATFEALDGKDAPSVWEQARLLGDSGYHSKENMDYLEGCGIDGYIADGNFRKRDPRFATAARHKPAAKGQSEKRFGPGDFIYDAENVRCVCPAGHSLYLKNRKAQINGNEAVCFQGAKRDCVECGLRAKCLRNPDQSTTRQVYFFKDRSDEGPSNATERMKAKIDTEEGRAKYSQRLGAVEPVFGNIRSNKRMDRFTLRGREKVNGQWLLYCAVHNIEKIQNYGEL